MLAPVWLSAVLLLGQSNAEIESVIKQYAQAAIDYDAVTIDRLFLPEYIEISPLGEFDSREKTIGYYRVPAEKRPKFKITFEIKEMNIRYPAKNLAVVIFRQEVTLHTGEKPTTLPFRQTSVLRKERDGWKFFSNHVSGIRERKLGG